jgi:F-type H+-transporting ATPase subunit b
MISVNATLVVQLVLFLTLLFILNRLMIQPLHKLSMEREDHVREKQEELVAMQSKIQELVDDCDRRLKQAEQEARGAQGKMRQQAQEEASQVITSAQEEVVALRQKARSEMTQELVKAREQLTAQAEALSFDVTERLVGRRI